MENLMVNNSKKSTLENLSTGKTFSSQLTIDNVIVKINIIDKDLPLIFCFSNAAERADLKDINYTPWGYDFILKEGLNVCSFASIGDANWYRSPTFHSFIQELGSNLKSFSKKLGYGASMGGFGVCTFSDVLGLDKVLVFNPISTLNKTLVPWETRFKRPAKNFDWVSDFHDSTLCNLNGYIVYDPIYGLDKKHADRYRTLIHLKLPGVGHGFPFHIQKMDFLKWLFRSFVTGDINQKKFYRLSRKRRNYRRYYKWMLSEENIHLTPKRKEIIKLHKDIYEFKNKQKFFLESQDIEAIKKSIVSLSSQEKELALTLINILKNNNINKNFTTYYLKNLDYND